MDTTQQAGQMQWTADKPTAPGWYWLQEPGNVPVIKEVAPDPMADADEQRLWVKGGPRSGWPLTSNLFTLTRWSGPIPLPV